jgi:hypothetical protein
VTRSPIDTLLDTVNWNSVEPPGENPDGLPYPTHTGTLQIAGYTLDCLVLNTGERIFTEESVERFFGGPMGGGE